MFNDLLGFMDLFVLAFYFLSSLSLVRISSSFSFATFVVLFPFSDSGTSSSIAFAYADCLFHVY